MKILKSFITAFSMYSKIPMPRVEWSGDNMKHSLCFFPLVGAVIGALFLLWTWICARLDIGNICFAAVAAAMPIFVSGGIHFDGFMDVSDALGSYGDTKKKLEIMKDPHVGAFAVIGAIVYFALYFALFTEVDTAAEIAAAACSYPLSRALSAITVSCFKCAKKDGLLFEFSSGAHIAAVRIVSVIYIMLIGPAVIFAWSCAAWLVIGAAAVVMIAIYYFMTRKNFGGITGDTAGWFVQVCELVFLATVVVLGRFI